MLEPAIHGFTSSAYAMLCYQPEWASSSILNASIPGQYEEISGRGQLSPGRHQCHNDKKKNTSQLPNTFPQILQRPATPLRH
jgi:hypothetical protein